MIREGSLEQVREVGDVVEVACASTGAFVAVNDSHGVVSFYSPAPESRKLPLELLSTIVAGVILHPDGRRVIAFFGGERPVVRLYDLMTGLTERVIELGDIDPEIAVELVELHEGIDEADLPGVDEGFYFKVAILADRPLLSWLLPIKIANERREVRGSWVNTLPEELSFRDIMPDRFTPLAIHPDGRRLVILDQVLWLVDLETGEAHQLQEGISWGRFLDDGEGPHSVDFDERGALTLGSTWISGNPFLEVEHIELDSFTTRATTEVWREQWNFGEEQRRAITIYDPASLLSPELIPEGLHKVYFRRRGVELWSNQGLIRSLPLLDGVSVIPSFDPGCFIASPRLVLIDAEGVDLVDLRSGEAHQCRLPAELGGPLRPAELTWVDFDRSRQRVIFVREGRELLATTWQGESWFACSLPEGRAMTRWSLSADASLLALVDHTGVLWTGSLELAPEAGVAAAEDLLDRLERAPEDESLHLIVADALSERGDPRGELIVLQHRGAEAEARALLQSHDLELTGGLGWIDAADVDLEWRLGFVRAASLRVASFDHLETVLCFLGTDAARLLESLEVRVDRPLPNRTVAQTCADLDAFLAAARRPRLLTSLTLGEPGTHQPSPSLLEAFPRLTAGAAR